MKGYRLTLISNIPSYAGGTLPAPQADFSDGVLEITPFKRLGKALGLFVFQNFPVLRKWYGNRLPHFPADRIELEIPKGNYLQIDGEDRTYLLADNKVEIEYGGQVSVLTG